MIRKGTKVRMSTRLKQHLRRTGSAAHVKEFGDCVGIVLGKVVYPNGKTYEEVDVRWQPSNLKYMYFKNQLVRVNK